MYVTLEEAKDHIRVDFDDDDIYIESLIEVSEAAIANEINEDFADILEGGELPKPLKQAILLLIGQLYNQREPVLIGSSVVKIPYTLEMLIAPYKNWTCA